jgi:hypothetical protein
MPFVKYGINLKDENDEYIKEQQVGMVQDNQSIIFYNYYGKISN